MPAGIEVFYPCEDDQPLTEVQAQALAISGLFGRLGCIFPDQFFYTVAGNPNIRFAPDVMVVFDIPKKLYDSYKLWETKPVQE
ncbi:MAG: hypothetical protein ACK4QL_08220 [Pseudanabaenaceae cyanobacterium]